MPDDRVTTRMATSRPGETDLSRPDLHDPDAALGAPSRPELSRPIAIARIARGSPIVVEADAVERALVARRLAVPDIASLRCRWELRRGGTDGDVEADGVLDALVTRTCVVTLEPLEEVVHEAFSVLFVPEERMPEEDDGDPDSPDLVGFEGAAIDLGEATVEQLALALDPFPRVPDALRAIEAADDLEIDDGSGGGAAAAQEEPATRPNPFAVLASRRGKS